MLTIAPLDYERYLALVRPLPPVEMVTTAASRPRHIEELTQISKRMDLWHEFSADGELQRRIAGKQGQQRAARPALTPAYQAQPVAEEAWSTVIEAAAAFNDHGGRLNSPPPKVASALYHTLTKPLPHTFSKTA